MGRPKSNVNSDEINQIILMYRQEKGSSALIDYKAIYEFNLELYSQGKCLKAFKNSFWRKIGQPGRIEVDSVNDLIRNKVATMDNNITVPDIRSVIYQYQEEPEKIVKKLGPLQTGFYAMDSKVKNLTEKVQKLELLLEEEKRKRKLKDDEAKRSQDCLFKMFRYSGDDDNSLLNQLRLKNPVSKQIENKRIANALEHLFDDPMRFYNMFDEQIAVNENVIPMKKHKRTILDDFKK